MPRETMTANCATEITRQRHRRKMAKLEAPGQRVECAL